MCLTSGWELFGIDDFGSVLLASAQFDTAAHHWKRSPGKQRQVKTGVRYHIALAASQYSRVNSSTVSLFPFLHSHWSERTGQVEGISLSTTPLLLSPSILSFHICQSWVKTFLLYGVIRVWHTAQQHILLRIYTNETTQEKTTKLSFKDISLCVHVCTCPWESETRCACVYCSSAGILGSACITNSAGKNSSNCLCRFSEQYIDVTQYTHTLTRPLCLTHSQAYTWPHVSHTHTLVDAMTGECVRVYTGNTLSQKQ